MPDTSLRNILIAVLATLVVGGGVLALVLRPSASSPRPVTTVALPVTYAPAPMPAPIVLAVLPPPVLTEAQQKAQEQKRQQAQADKTQAEYSAHLSRAIDRDSQRQAVANQQQAQQNQALQNQRANAAAQNFALGQATGPDTQRVHLAPGQKAVIINDQP